MHVVEVEGLRASEALDGFCLFDWLFALITGVISALFGVFFLELSKAEWHFALNDSRGSPLRIGALISRQKARFTLITSRDQLAFVAFLVEYFLTPRTLLRLLLLHQRTLTLQTSIHISQLRRKIYHRQRRVHFFLLGGGDRGRRWLLVVAVLGGFVDEGEGGGFAPFNSKLRGL